MKHTITKRAIGAVILSSALLLASAASSQASGQPDLTYYVVLNVASLVNNGNGPFSLDLQLAPGSDNQANTVTLTNFVFLNGSVAAGSPTYSYGGESGSEASTVTLTSSSSVDNELAQAFTAGTTQISFHVDQTINPETGVNAVPAQFLVYLDDASTNFIPTTDSTNSSLVTSTIVESEVMSDVQTFSSTSPDAGVTASISAVPEPGSAAMLLLGACGLFARRRAFRRA